MKKLETSDDMTNAEILEHLSILTEQYGFRFQYEVDNNEITGMQVEVTDNPDHELVAGVCMLAIQQLAHMAFVALADHNRMAPISKRHMEIRQLLHDLNGQLMHSHELICLQVKSEIEIAGSITKH
jgi:hypothetical protein